MIFRNTFNRSRVRYWGTSCNTDLHLPIHRSRIRRQVMNVRRIWPPYQRRLLIQLDRKSCELCSIRMLKLHIDTSTVYRSSRSLHRAWSLPCSTLKLPESILTTSWLYMCPELPMSFGVTTKYALRAQFACSPIYFFTWDRHVSIISTESQQYTQIEQHNEQLG
jgi:hypothetical protein